MLNAEPLFRQFPSHYERRHIAVAEIAGTRWRIVSNGCAVVAEETADDLVACKTSNGLLPETLRMLVAATRTETIDVAPLRAWLAVVAPPRAERVVIPCEGCDGTGERKCLKCDGTGEVECYACGHDEECKACRGEGFVPCKCGNVADDAVPSTAVGWRGQSWNGAALAAALDLLGAERVEVAQSTHPLDGGVLRADGRWVIVMPMNAPAAAAYQEAA